MEPVISISSDEEVFDELKENPRKKIKTEELDNDKEKKYVSDNEDSDSDINLSNEHDSSDIESDNDIQYDKNSKNGCSKESKISGNSKLITQDECIDNISIESDDDSLIAVPVNDETNKTNDLDLDKQISLSLAEMFNDCKELQIFIELCLSQIHNEETKTLFKSKLPLCKKVFDKTDKKYINSECFKTFLNEKMMLSKTGSIKAVSSFNDVYQHLKNQIRKPETDDITNKNEVIIAKLEHALNKIQRKIVKLEESEINFDDEENSNYIKLQRYKERAVKIYEKLCKYNKQDVHANQILYSRLDFSGSNYPEFNHAINRKFKNNLVFPTYYEVELCLRKVVKNKDINLTESKFKSEVAECFKSLGNLLQKRRKIDLLDIHSHYLTVNDDPAYTDRDLDAKLNASFKEAKSKIDLICEKYAKLQDAGVDPSLSSDSDDSKHKSTDSEEDE